MIFVRQGHVFQVLVRSAPRTFTTHQPTVLLKRLLERGYRAEHDDRVIRDLLGALLGDWYRPPPGGVVLLIKERSAPILLTMGGLVVVVPGRCEKAAARALTLSQLTVADTALADAAEFR